MADLTPQEFTVHNPAAEDLCLDIYLVKRLNHYSRTLIQKLIKEGLVLVNGKKSKASYEICVDDKLEVRVPRIIESQTVPEDIPLDVIYEDEHLILVNKPPHFVVHPAAGHWEGTLVNALLFHCGVLPTTDDVYRPGIVHRLDKNTSGVILAAKTVKAHQELQEQFEARTVAKQYLAIVEGEPRFDSEWVEAPIGHDPRDREKMTVGGRDPRDAATFYETVERFRGYALVRAAPKTGRTHQIRVHLMHIGYPVLADSAYGKHESLFEWSLEGHARRPIDLPPTEPLIARQALHAHRLEFTHPATGERVAFSAPLAPDMEVVLAALRRWRSR
ncbi:MAG: RluA family pseudouridine synthase [Planctomycetes bacterium]|nr:RluA family pseudouridine synthase [Planctomycetota bacterium]